MAAAALPINRAWCARGEQLGCPAHAYGTTRVVGIEPPTVRAASLALLWEPPLAGRSDAAVAAPGCPGPA